MTCVQLCYSSDFGSMEGVSAPHGKLPKAFMPTRVQTRDGSALFVLNHGKPVVTLRSGDRELSFDADAIAWGGGRDDWSVDSARRMVDLLIEDDGLRQAAIELRNAMLLVPLQYAGASGQPGGRAFRLREHFPQKARTSLQRSLHHRTHRGKNDGGAAEDIDRRRADGALPGRLRREVSC